MTERELVCDVCGAKATPKKGKPAGQLNLCGECDAEFGESNVYGCC